MILEINSQPTRLDLPDDLVKLAIEWSRLIINTDSHSVSELNFMKYGVNVARRGWAEKIILLTHSVTKNLLKN